VSESKKPAQPPLFSPDKAIEHLLRGVPDPLATALDRALFLPDFTPPAAAPRKRGGRPPGRVVSLGRIARAYQELSAASDKRVSQADVAEKLHEALRNVERALADVPEFWEDLTRPI
jgi:hypothetical protein